MGRAAYGCILVSMDDVGYAITSERRAEGFGGTNCYGRNLCRGYMDPCSFMAMVGVALVLYLLK